MNNADAPQPVRSRGSSSSSSSSIDSSSRRRGEEEKKPKLVFGAKNTQPHFARHTQSPTSTTVQHASIQLTAAAKKPSPCKVSDEQEFKPPPRPSEGSTLHPLRVPLFHFSRRRKRMSIAQESYIPPTAHTTAPPTMDLNNMIHARQPYERYSQLPEGSQQAPQGPQMQLPPQPIAGEPQVVSTIHEGRLYRYGVLDRKQR